MATQTSTSAPVSYGYCHWHKGPSETAVLVRIIEQGSGPGAGLYACEPCRGQHHLVPVAEHPDEVAYRAYLDHTAVCPECGRPGRCDSGTLLWKAYRAALTAVGF
ncbi:hypothetical protein ACFW9O_19130 [Streptomyces sp. NPDC059499]|uniref:hypothetical protein n=1 Tax=Streptomyces sp. NPDC059499 TaxID=3346852 RepID=UPI00367D9CC6